MEETYLGYGVYAKSDPDLEQIIVTVDRGPDGEHFVALTDDELRNLNDFAKRCFPSWRL